MCQDQYHRAKNVPAVDFRAYDLVVATVVVSIAVALHALDVPGARGSGLERNRLDNGATLLSAPPASVPPAVLAGARGPRAQGDLVRETLANGMRLVVKRDASTPVVAMRAVWTGGLHLESPAESGIGALLAGAMTGGCGDRDAGALARRVREMAGVLAGVAGRNTLGLRAEWPARSWREGMALMADCIVAPRFEASAVAREQRRLLAAVRARAQNPRALAFRTFAEALYGAHPYARDPLGTPASVAALDRQRVASFYRQRFPASALTLVVVGDIAPDEVVAQGRQLFAGEAPGSRRPRRPAPRDEGAARAREIYRYLDHGQAHLVIGFPGTTVDDPNRFALQVLAAILGGPGGRLRVELGERRALVHRVSAVSVEGVTPGYLAVHLSCRPALLPAAVRSVRAALARVVAEPVDAEELARARRYLIDIHAAAVRQPGAQAAALGFHAAYGLDLAGYLGYEDEIRSVDATDLQHIAAAYIDWDEAVTATVKPPDATPEAARRARGVKRRMKRSARRRQGRAGRARGQ